MKKSHLLSLFIKFIMIIFAIGIIYSIVVLSLIISGTQNIPTSEPDSEANVMANYLIKKGIPAEKIIREDTSTRTKENIQNAQKKQDLNNTVIVTSDYHVYRGKLLAKRLGIKEVSGLPAPSYKWLIVNNYFRETIALGYALIFD